MTLAPIIVTGGVRCATPWLTPIIDVLRSGDRETQTLTIASDLRSNIRPMKWNTKVLILSGANWLFAGLAGLAQTTNSDSNTDNAGTKTAVVITHDDGLLYAPTYEECMKSGQAVVTRLALLTCENTSQLLNSSSIMINKNILALLAFFRCTLHIICKDCNFNNSVQVSKGIGST